MRFGLSDSHYILPPVSASQVKEILPLIAVPGKGYEALLTQAQMRAPTSSLPIDLRTQEEQRHLEAQKVAIFEPSDSKTK